MDFHETQPPPPTPPKATTGAVRPAHMDPVQRKHKAPRCYQWQVGLNGLDHTQPGFFCPELPPDLTWTARADARATLTRRLATHEEAPPPERVFGPTRISCLWCGLPEDTGVALHCHCLGVPT